MAEIWYRLEVVVYSYVDEWENAYSGRPKAEWQQYEVIKTTPKGVWLKKGWWGQKRFVLRDAKKRFACPTKAEAKESFISRKKRQISILTTQLNSAKEALACGSVVSTSEIINNVYETQRQSLKRKRN